MGATTETPTGIAAQVPATTPTTPAPTPTPRPASTPTPRPALSLGEPKWLGRGELVGAYFTPDGTAIAIGWANGVSLVDVATAAERWWQPTAAPVVAIDVHPEGQAVAAALADGSIVLFDAATGTARRVTEAEPHIYHGDIAWSPDGERLAFQFVGPHRQDPIHVLGLQRGTRHTVPGSQITEGMLPALIWTPGGRGITLTDFGKRCTAVLDVETGERLFTLRIGEGCPFPFAMTWSPDGRRFALVAEQVVLVDPDTGAITRTMAGSTPDFTLSRGGFSRTGHPLLFNADGTLLAGKGGIADLGSGAGFLNNLFPLVVWNVETGERVAQLGEVGNAYELGLANRDRLAIGFDGDDLLSLYENGEITRWAFAAAPAGEVVIGHIPVIAAQAPLIWSADGRRLAASNRYGGVAVWDVATGALAARFDAPLDAPALSPDGHLIALTDRERNEEVIYDLESGERLLTLPESTSRPQATAFSPDGTQLAYGSRNRVIVADVTTGEQMAVLTAYPKDQVITRVIWAPDGEALVAASSSPNGAQRPGQLVLWQRAENGEFEELLRTQTVRTDYEDEPLALFNPAGDLVALESLPRAEAGQFTILVYDRQARRVIRRLREYQLAAWVTDQVLLTSEAQYWTRLTRWNVRTGEQTVGVGRELGDNVYAPGGVFYARPNSQAPYYTRGIEVRDWKTGRVVARGAYESSVMAIRWSPAGQWIVALATDGTLKVWSVAH